MAVVLCFLSGMANANQQAQRAYRRATARLAAARSLHVKVRDNLQHRTSEYWFRKPNRYKIVGGDGTQTLCDGQHLVTISQQGHGRWQQLPPVSRKRCSP